VLVADAAAGQKRIPAELDALAVGIIDEFLDPVHVGRVGVLHVEPAAEGHDDHLESDFGALIYRELDRLRVGTADVHENRVLRDPGGECDTSAARPGPSSRSSAVVHQSNVGTSQGRSGFDDYIRRAAAVRAGRASCTIVDLGGILRVRNPEGGLYPPSAVIAMKSVVALDVKVGQLPARRLVDQRFRLHSRQIR
jgi:hypothetical protein